MRLKDYLGIECGPNCTCDDCQGIHWPPPPVLTPEQVEEIKRGMYQAGLAFGALELKMWLEVCRNAT